MIIVQTLITALLSGLFSGFVLFVINDRRDRTSRRLNKLEEAAEGYFAWAAGAADYIHSAHNIASSNCSDAEWRGKNEPVYTAAVRSLGRATTYCRDIANKPLKSAKIASPG